jgi:hypothetical protein
MSYVDDYGVNFGIAHQGRFPISRHRGESLASLGVRSDGAKTFMPTNPVESGIYAAISSNAESVVKL